MKYISVCSGIESATAAWAPLGWRAQWFAEIEAFPSAVLAHHYPEITNRGDMTNFAEWPDADVDVLVGGTPCQSFSVAGRRAGLDDSRGSLMLTYLEIAERYRPRWLVWENVPGVLSVDSGRAFGALLGGLVKLGYGWAYRILDAQYFNLAQRRARVFVVASSRGWASAAAVLFERASLQGDPAPSREAGKAAPTIPSRSTAGGGLGTDFDCDGGLIAATLAFGGNNQTGSIDVATACNAHGGSGRMDFESETFIAHTLRGEGFDASEDGTGRGTPLVPVSLALRGREGGATAEVGGDCAFALRASSGGGDKPHAMVPTQAVAIQAGALRENPSSGPDGIGVQEGLAYTMEARSEVQAVQWGYAVRRLTPRECERLQGFPDDYTLIPYRGKPAADGPRYRALGNSKAVPVVRWIGRRIQAVDQLTQDIAA